MQTLATDFLYSPDYPKPTIRDKAQQVCSLAQQEGHLPTDPHHVTFVLTILTVIEIITALISLYNACRAAVPKATESLHNPDRFAQLRLRRVIREHAPEALNEDRLAYHITQVAGGITEDEVAKMYAEVSK